MLAVSTFDSTKTDLVELLGNAKSGDAQLPDFQRGWVWDDDHIRDLIASVSRSFPIGTVMLLENGGDVAFRTRPLEGAEIDGRDPELLILDGQQRLTSLFQALVAGGPVRTRDAKRIEIERWYYLDVRKALDVAVDREDAVLSIPADRCVRSDFGRRVDLDLTTPDREFANFMFPLAHVFDHYQWAQGFREHHGHDPETSRIWDEFEREIVQRFRSYQLPVIRLHRQTPKEAVCLVFEKVNTGGVSLSVFELLTASFAAVASDGFELRDDWDRRRRRLHDQPVLRDVASTDFMQAVTLLATLAKRERHLDAGEPAERAPVVSCKRRDILRLTLDEYLAWAEPLTQGFQRAARFLHRERVFETKFLPYSTQLVPLAVTLTILGDRGNDSPQVRDRIARWYWCGVFGELYGSATETRFARDVPELLAYAADDAVVPSSISDANLAPDRLHTLRSRRSAAYKGIYVLLLREGARDFRTGETSTDQTYFDEAVDIHHVFPKKWCRERSPDPVPAARFDSIVNKTPLTARTNRAIGGRAPSEYLRGLRERDGIAETVEDANLRSHMIEVDALRADDFERFFEARQRALLLAIGQVMGKSLVAEAVTVVEPASYDELDADDA
ncbi:DUF262 domain-containing protein [Conexibacter woesei]|uniref:GmrSD restriction endonucleases N-terminal domain-containing protein n=1 Tax=Conexibacter woesei (strain DSM 14684 / CCUG 47730 / CIP 108061 / JCM 11494 / NBRC 100937 / ID131577) TaxID=469383 RepID=D3FE60_CONWI|nr:DUF262 domain-containing protein [Conexibacter woesei]ADB51676.1 Protein of unknown function DUF2081 [Conexibacter woesei DSM 14684]